MGMECIPGLTGDDTRATTKMTRSMGLVLIHGPMGGSMWANGKMTRDTVGESILSISTIPNKDSGKKIRGYSG